MKIGVYDESKWMFVFGVIYKIILEVLVYVNYIEFLVKGLINIIGGVIILIKLFVVE